MSDLLSRLEIELILGVALALVFVLVARRGGRHHERLAYGVGLGVAAAIYVVFGLAYGAPARHLLVEGTGVALFAAVAMAGVLRWPLVLGFGWLGHMVWDLFLHYADGPAFAPPWYAPLCVGFDLFLAGYIVGLVVDRRD